MLPPLRPAKDSPLTLRDGRIRPVELSLQEQSEPEAKRQKTLRASLAFEYTLSQEVKQLRQEAQDLRQDVENLRQDVEALRLDVRQEFQESQWLREDVQRLASVISTELGTPVSLKSAGD